MNHQSLVVGRRDLCRPRPASPRPRPGAPCPLRVVNAMANSAGTVFLFTSYINDSKKTKPNSVIRKSSTVHAIVPNSISSQANVNYLQYFLIIYLQIFRDPNFQSKLSLIFKEWMIEVIQSKRPFCLYRLQRAIFIKKIYWDTDMKCQ